MKDAIRLLVITGYYDDFSGYQEVVLARALSRRECHVTVLAGDRVSPIFTDESLHRLGRTRRYSQRPQWDESVTVQRFSYLKMGSLLVPGPRLFRELKNSRANGVVILALGQGFSAPAAWFPRGASRVVIFGDNRAQWALRGWRAFLKTWAFAQTKGRLYRRVIGRSRSAFGITPNTLSRLAGFAGPDGLQILPLAVDCSIFHPDEEDRARERAAQGWEADQRVLAVVGKVESGKNIERVVQAASAWPADANWRLVIAGLGSDAYSTSIRDLVSGNPDLRSRSTLLGYLKPEQLAALIRATDVCVWPKQPAITIQQALASGTRIIVPANDLTGHLVTTSMDGMAVSESLDESLEAAIADQLTAFDDAETRRSRAARASYLTSDSVAARLLQSLGLDSAAGTRGDGSGFA